MHYYSQSLTLLKARSLPEWKSASSCSKPCSMARTSATSRRNECSFVKRFTPLTPALLPPTAPLLLPGTHIFRSLTPNDHEDKLFFKTNEHISINNWRTALLHTKINNNVSCCVLPTLSESDLKHILRLKNNLSYIKCFCQNSFIYLIKKTVIRNY